MPGEQSRPVPSTKKSLWLAALALFLMIASLLSVFIPARHGVAAPYLGCSSNGYIVRDSSGGGGHTDIQSVDMVTGQGSAAGQIQNRQLNAIGYNPKDDHFYAWDLQNGVFVKVSSDFSTVTPYTAVQMSYPGPTTGVFSGDVDEDGYHWSFTVSGGTTTWYRINLNTATPTYVETGSTANPTGAEGTDWAYVPGTDNLYRGMDSGGTITIVAFNRTSKTYSTIGTVANITTPADGDMGSVYADPDGNFYMSSHNSGSLFRINLGDAPNFTAVELDAVDPNSNDGARCALASIPVDLGDAPSSYDTAIDDDGARHSIINFDITNSTAPLQLGNNIDIEVDGFPGVSADGDDNDHEGLAGSGYVDDERGIQHIVATPGSSDSLVVPVKVKNTSGQAAVLAGWVDLDNDGAFEVGERITANIASGFTGTEQLTFPAPPAPYSVNTYARFRLFAANDTSTAATNLLPAGPALGGEVEDVLVQVGTYSVTKSSNPVEGSTVDPGSTVTYGLAIQNTGSTALANLKIDDDLSDVLDDATLEGAPIVSPASAGTAAINDTTLEFVGDIAAGDTVTVTYSVKIKDGATLGNAALNNIVLAAHSTSCHPTVSGGAATVTHEDCTTDHTVNSLADTGSNTTPLFIIAGLLIAGSIGALYLNHRQQHITK